MSIRTRVNNILFKEADESSSWVRVPVIPAAGTELYLYYGNPTPSEPELVEVGPIGPWDKYTGYIQPIGDPDAGSRLLAENVVWDPATGHYWMV